MWLPFPCAPGELLKDSDRRQIHCGDREASLSVSCAYKEDEGFYSVRIPTLDGFKEQKAYVFVRGGYNLSLLLLLQFILFGLIWPVMTHPVPLDNNICYHFKTFSMNWMFGVMLYWNYVGLIGWRYHFRPFQHKLQVCVIVLGKRG